MSFAGEGGAGDRWGLGDRGERCAIALLRREQPWPSHMHVKDQEDEDARYTLEIIKQVKTSDAKDPIAVAADLSFDENCGRVVEEVAKVYGRIDILVNNAAEQYKNSSVEEIDEARLERVFRTNIVSNFFMARYVDR